MVHVLEDHGVRVFSLAERVRELDAYSLWHGSRPLAELYDQVCVQLCRLKFMKQFVRVFFVDAWIKKSDSPRMTAARCSELRGGDFSPLPRALAPCNSDGGRGLTEPICARGRPFAENS
jgi:hypothetical protein